MSAFTKPIPLTLYIHIPWCIRKCPYCDFNSHKLIGNLPERDYIATLIRDLEQDLPLVWGRRLSAIFIGGGTPSLFSPDALEQLLQQIHARLPFSNIEVTLEANPGTVEQQRFEQFYQIGINRLSLGIQSFQDDKLKQLGRIHNGTEAQKAIQAAKLAGFSNFNLDLMHGLPYQNLDAALFDLTTALSFNPTHLSWYQLTLEPHTQFYNQPPALPDEDDIWNIQEQGQHYLAKQNYLQYEVSAYSKPGFQCDHNRNYWEFGDYLGIGAGAHSKITDFTQQTISRFWKVKHPKQYLTTQSFVAEKKVVSEQELPFEFMLNALRLNEKIPLKLFEERTGLKLTAIHQSLQQAKQNNLMDWDDTTIYTTELGKRYLNDLISIFLS
jgi:putative oxygen-independent coproporphyrinogen III oxidase